MKITSIFCQIYVYFVLLTNIIVLITSSPDVSFDAPQQIRKNELYRLIIRNQSPGIKFPDDNFAFSFELLKSLKPRVELSIADVSSFTFTGEEYRGFSIKDFVIKKDLIDMHIEFRPEAHNTTFRVRYTSAKTEGDKEDFYISKTDTGIILQRKIEMFLPYTITLQVGPEIREVPASDREAVGHVLLPDKNGQISCQATDGLPNSYPTFENSYILFGASVNAVTNDATKLVWMVRMNDHGKQIQCRAGQQIKNITLNVYHYMSNIRIMPDTNTKVPGGSQLKCGSKDGFPIPKTEWNFVSGPQDSDKYYELRDEKTVLLLNSSTPVNSNWTFECQGSNYIAPVVAKYLGASPNYPIRYAYNFSIVGSDNSNVNSSNAGVIVVVFLLITCTIALIVVGIVHKEKVLKFVNSKRPGAGQSSKTQQKSGDFVYKYKEVSKCDNNGNGSTDKDQEGTSPYNEIVEKPKSNNPLGPIHRV